MQYLDDIVELIEDVPQEMTKRFEQIGVWEKAASEHVEEYRRMLNILDSNNSMDENAKAEMVSLMAENLQKARDLTQQKVDLSARTERLLSTIFENVNEYAYHCKLELEVDSSGSTLLIENAFIRDAMNSRPYDMCSTGSFSISSRESSPSVNRESVATTTVLSERTNKGRGKPSYENKKMKKRGGQTQVSAGSTSVPQVMSNYMRKKKERLREQKKLIEIHANREKEKCQQQQQQKIVVKDEPLDLATFCAEAVGIKNAPEKEEKEVEKEPEMDDEDDLADVFDIFPAMLPSPPTELFDSIKGDMAFGDLSSVFADDPYPPGQEDRTPSPSVSMRGERKRKQITFSSASESLHGRPRKLTSRAEELLSESERREKEKRKKEEEEEDDDAPYCYCQQPSYGNMIMCENQNCRFKWFHFLCLNLDKAPEGTWYCKECR